METEVLIAVIAGLGGMLGWGLADFFAKKTIDRIGDVASLAWGHIFGSLVLVGMALYQIYALHQQLTIPSTFKSWGLLIFFGVMQAAVYLLVYKGFSKGFVGILSPIFASFSGLTAVVSVLVLGEVVGGYLLLGLIVLFIGILLINVDVQALKSWRLSFTKVKGFKEIALATLMATVWTLAWDKFIEGQDWLSYALLMYVFMTIVILIVARLQDISLRRVPSSIWKFLVLIGACETIAYVAISSGYSLTSLTSVVALLSGAFSLPTIILARMFLNENITFTQTVGSLVTIGGIMLLVTL